MTRTGIGEAKNSPRKKGKVFRASNTFSGTCFDHATLWAFRSSIIHPLLLVSDIIMSFA
jgi:hypothetical protein